MSNVDPETARAVMHHAEYGARGNPQTERVIPSRQLAESEFVLPYSAPWNQPNKYADVPKLLLGFQPQQMEGKWIVYADDPDEHGKGAIHFFRSWTRYKIHQVDFVVKIPEGDQGKGEAYFTQITWETGQSHISAVYTRQEARVIVTEILRWVMDIHLPLHTDQEA